MQISHLSDVKIRQNFSHPGRFCRKIVLLRLIICTNNLFTPVINHRFSHWLGRYFERALHMRVSDDNYDLGGKWLPLLLVDMRDRYAKLLVFCLCCWDLHVESLRLRLTFLPIFIEKIAPNLICTKQFYIISLHFFTSPSKPYPLSFESIKSSFHRQQSATCRNI